MTKVKTFWTNCTNDDEFDEKVNDFIKEKMSFKFLQVTRYCHMTTIHIR